MVPFISEKGVLGRINFKGNLFHVDDPKTDETSRKVQFSYVCNGFYQEYEGFCIFGEVGGRLEPNLFLGGTNSIMNPIFTERPTYINIYLLIYIY